MKMQVMKMEMSYELEAFCNCALPTHDAVNVLNMGRPQALLCWSTLKQYLPLLARIFQLKAYSNIL